MCAHTAGFEGVTRGKRAARIPCEPSRLGLLVPLAVDGEPAIFIRSVQVHGLYSPYLGHRGWDTKHEAIGPCGGASAQVV